MAGPAPLARVVVQNFQAHARLEVDLDPKVTVVVGPSDCGKSSLVRALRFALLNGVKGAGFVRWGYKAATVTVVVGKDKVVRKRGKGANAYRLNGKTFTAFGQGVVPDEVRAVLNCRPDNFQGQLDPPFWFMDSPGQVSKSLNRIVNLDKIDRVLAALARKAAAAKAEQEFTRGRLDAAREKRDKLKWATGFAAAVERLERLKADFDSKASRRAAFASSLKKAIGAGRRANRLLKATLGAENVVAAGRTARQAMVKAGRLAKLLQEAKRAGRVAALPTPDTTKLLAARKSADRSADVRAEFEGLVREATLAKDVLCGRTEQLADGLTQLSSATKGKCPLCHQTVSSESWSATSTCGTGHP